MRCITRSQFLKRVYASSFKNSWLTRNTKLSTGRFVICILLFRSASKACSGRSPKKVFARYRAVGAIWAKQRHLPVGRVGGRTGFGFGSVSVFGWVEFGQQDKKIRNFNHGFSKTSSREPPSISTTTCARLSVQRHGARSSRTIPYQTIPYRTIPYHTMTHHTIPDHTIPYRTIPYHTITHHTIPYLTIPSLIHSYLLFRGSRSTCRRHVEQGPKVAVHQLSFAVARGDCFGFLGINGAGMIFRVCEKARSFRCRPRLLWLRRIDMLKKGQTF